MIFSLKQFSNTQEENQDQTQINVHHDITITKALFENTCVDGLNDIDFDLAVTVVPDTDLETIPHIHIQIKEVKNESLTIPVHCSYLLDNTTIFTCYTEKDLQEGSFQVNNPEDQTINDNLIYKYTSSEKVTVNKKYIEPQKTFFNYSHNYYDSENKTLVIYYGANVSEPFPAYMNDKLLNCTADKSNQVRCIITKSEFPPDESQPSEFKKYTGYVLNACGEKQINLELNVKYQSPKELINLKETIFTEECNTLKETDITFQIRYETAYRKDIMPFTAYLIGNSNKINVECIQEGKELLFTCKTTEKVQNSDEYQAKVEKQETTEYIINEYTSSNKIIFTLKKYVKPKAGKITVIHDYSVSEEDEFPINFTDIVPSDDLPKVYFNVSPSTPSIVELSCYSKNDTLLHCKYNSSVIKPSITPLTPYLGYIVNVCGLKEKNKELEMYAFISSVITITGTVFIEKCSLLRKGTPFTLYYNISGEEYGYVNITIIKLQSQNDPSKLISTICSIEYGSIECNTTEDATLEGEYKAFLDKDTTISPYKILKFISNRSTTYNEKYVRPVDKLYSEIVDFNEQTIGKINFEFTTNIKVMPKIYVKETQKYMDKCSSIDNNMLCEFTIEDFPVNESSSYDFKKYEPVMINACGNEEKQLNITILVRKYRPKMKSNITISKVTYDSLSKCYQFTRKNSITFRLQCEINSLLNDKIQIENVDLYKTNDRTKFFKNANCSFMDEEHTFTCTSKGVLNADGYYLALMMNNYDQNENYTIWKFESKEDIYLTSLQNNSLLNKTAKVKYDYAANKTGAFYLFYKEKIEDIPEVILDNKKLNCSVYTENEYILKCEFEIINFPAKSKVDYVSYLGVIQNICGQKVINLNVSVINTSGSRFYGISIIILLAIAIFIY